MINVDTCISHGRLSLGVKCSYISTRSQFAHEVKVCLHANSYPVSIITTIMKYVIYIVITIIHTVAIGTILNFKCSS